jgi:hypothetical protein
MFLQYLCSSSSKGLGSSTGERTCCFGSDPELPGTSTSLPLKLLHAQSFCLTLTRAFLLPDKPVPEPAQDIPACLWLNCNGF